MNWLRIIVILLAGCFPAFTQPLAAPDGESVLAEADAAYTSIERFFFVASEESVTSSKGFERKTSTYVLTAADGEGRMRVEFDNQTSGGVAVLNGETYWLLVPSLGQYVEGAADESGGFPQVPGIDFNNFLRRFPQRYTALADRVVKAEIVREETLDLDDGRHVCYVISAEYDPPPGMREGSIARTYWIDKKTKLVIREESLAGMIPQSSSDRVTVTQNIDFKIALSSGSVPQELFQFTPPPNARKVESFSGPAAAGAEAPDMTAKLAPDFSLTDLNGKLVRLSELRGKAVLLDFWASWCGPCRYDMPHIEQMHKERGKDGLVVLGVNGENPEAAKAYLQQNGYTFPTLNDDAYQVSRLYGVRAIPTIVVIDRQGSVSSYMRGLHSESQLRDAVEKAL